MARKFDLYDIMRLSEEYGEMPPHTFDKNGICTKCGVNAEEWECAPDEDTY